MKRLEYPNPQFERKDFEILNGQWAFEIDNDFSGFKRDLFNKKLSDVIEVPFSPESELSGINYKGFINACWYKKEFVLTREKLEKRVTINFGAVDYIASIYINKKYVGYHKGGYSSFSIDITDYVSEGVNEVIVYVLDDTKGNIPSGKQSSKETSYGCFYTRVTGIWQTVYLEFTPKIYIKSVKYYPNIKDASVDIEIITSDTGILNVEIYHENTLVGEKNGLMIERKKRFNMKLSKKVLWELGKGGLYDVKFTYNDDQVKSYFGLREVKYDKTQFLLNGKSVFQRLVLDQGYYKKGIYTAETVDEMAQDIKNSMALGFNGARLHQKVFEPLFLSLCDKMGYMVWGEYPSWGVRYSDLNAIGTVLGEWREVVERDFNHPSIVTWCPLNETWEDLDDVKKVRDVRFVDTMYEFTKIMDPTRPCVGVSGGFHGTKTDLYDFHCYDKFDGLKKHVDNLNEHDTLTLSVQEPTNVKDQPVNVSEYGGVAFGKNVESVEPSISVLKTSAWGYETASNEEIFVNEYIQSTKMLLNSPKLSGFCYTQLYDVEQEQNGFYDYDRKLKISDESLQKIVECNQSIAMIEKL